MARETGQNPLKNARKKAAANWLPVFFCDSGLYFDGVPGEDQPDVYVRTVNGRRLTDRDDQPLRSTGKKYGELTARYQNAVCFIEGPGVSYESMDDSLSGDYFLDREQNTVAGFALDMGFRTFFQHYL